MELENAFPREVTKYLVLVTTSGYQDTEEAIVLGTEQEDSMWECTDVNVIHTLYCNGGMGGKDTSVRSCYYVDCYGCP